MPLLDHFRPPLYPRHRWESFHSNWATRIADALNARLPAEFLAEEFTSAGNQLQIDVATFAEEGQAHTSGPRDGLPTATLASPVYTPPAAAQTMPGVFPDTFEVRVIHGFGGLRVVAAIELISPGNKDRAEERRAFAAKCASYLYQGISLIIVDIVTNRRANLHNEIIQVMAAAPEYRLSDDVDLYAVAYRPVLRQDRPEIDLWNAPVTLGAGLPTLPLRLTGDQFLPVDFEATYEEARRHRRFE